MAVSLPGLQSITRVAPVGKLRFASVRVQNILPVLFRYLQLEITDYHGSF